MYLISFLVTKTCRCLFSSSSSSAQQQANLIPGLNLNALGIFSSGLPMLPPAAGPRGAVPAVAPAGYNPFLVSMNRFLPITIFFFERDRGLVLRNLYPTHSKPGSSWSGFWMKQHRVDSGLRAWCCTQQPEIPRLPQRWVSLSLKQKSPLTIRWECVCEWICILQSKELTCDSLWIYALKFSQARASVVSSEECVYVCVCVCFNCVFLCRLIGLLVTSLSESLFTSQWPVRGSSSKCHPPPALSMFPKIHTAANVFDFPWNSGEGRGLIRGRTHCMF